MLQPLIISAALVWMNAPPAAMMALPERPIAVVTGPVDEHFSSRLSRLIRQNPHVQMIEIESPGGFVDEAFRSARLLNDRGISVRVRGRCASACAYLWASTNSRYLREGAVIGVHESKQGRELPGFLSRSLERRSASMERQALMHAGFPPELIEKARSVPHESMLWLTPHELQQAGVMFEFFTDGAPNSSLKRTNQSLRD